jgi:F0F1-type ATP synthase membrane subunit b/b'
MSEKRNAFDEISELLGKGDITPSNPISVDIGANNFFEIDFPTNPVSVIEDTVEPLIIPNTKEPKETKTEEDSTTVTNEDEETASTEVIEVEDDKDSEDYSDWNDLSLIALTQIKSGKWDLDEKEIPKDLDANTLLELFEAQEKNSYERAREEVYSQAGEFANYMKFLMDGGDPNVVRDAMEIKKISLTDISEEEGQREVLTALLELKGLDEDLVNSTLETIFDKGKGKLEAVKAQEQLRKYEDSILENKNKELENQRKLQEKQYNEYVENFTNTVRKGKIGGLDIDKKKQDQIIAAFLKPTETIETTDPRTGKVVPQKITKSTKLFNEVNQDPEKLAALTLWLLEGGTFEGIKEQVKEKKDDSLRDILRGRKSVTVVNKQKQNTNNAFEVLANRNLHRSI